MSKEEISSVNTKVANQELYFYQGIAVSQKLKAGLVAEDHTYIYPIVDDIILLKKDTAITPKNRTKNPLLRVSEESENKFFDSYKLLKKGRRIKPTFKKLQSKPLTNEQLMKLKELLPKEGECFMSAVTHDVDALHNLAFNANFNHFLHIDFSIERLQAIKSDIKAGTMLILCDNSNLPFCEDAIDSLFSFDYINEYEKDEQKLAYQELKRVVKTNGVSVVLYDKNKPLYAETQLKTDQLSKKALGLLAPWKKRKVPTIYFHPIENKGHDNSEELYTKTSFGEQFS